MCIPTRGGSKGCTQHTRIEGIENLVCGKQTQLVHGGGSGFNADALRSLPRPTNGFSPQRPLLYTSRKLNELSSFLPDRPGPDGTFPLLPVLPSRSHPPYGSVSTIAPSPVLSDRPKSFVPDPLRRLRVPRGTRRHSCVAIIITRCRGALPRV